MLFCENNLSGGWWYPTIETPPGIYIEESQDNHKRLTKAELTSLVVLWEEMQARGAWVKIGFEMDREYGIISIKANVGDAPTLAHPSLWKLENLDGHRCWAVEFPSEGGFIRRTFFANTKYHVPDLDSRGRVVVK